MQHLFDIKIAQEFGVEVAIFLKNMSYWVTHNMANDVNWHDGTYWTYNSREAYTEIFPYWSSDQIKRIIKKCIDQDLIKVGNYNDKKYDHTNWYSLTNKSCKLLNLLIGRNRPIDQAISPNPLGEIAQPIPNNKPDIKPDKRESASRPERKKRAPLSDSFKPSEPNQALLETTAKKSGLSREELLAKFRALAKSKEKLSADWQAELEIFLLNEKPKLDFSIGKTIPKPYQHQEIRCTVPEYGPGHPQWELNHGKKGIMRGVEREI